MLLLFAMDLDDLMLSDTDVNFTNYVECSIFSATERVCINTCELQQAMHKRG